MPPTPLTTPRTPSPDRAPAVPTPSLREKLGLCQWFHYEDYTTLDRTVKLLRDLNVKHLRTAISWADYLRPGGRRWYDHQMAALAEFDVLLSVWHTPPSLSENGACNGPPRRLRDYADFIDLLITDYRRSFAHLELWNEPNNRLKWDFPNCDPHWNKFAEMIGAAAYWCQQRHVPTVLGGMIPVDHHWLDLMRAAGVLQYCDVVAIHAFPGMWFPDHPNWDWHDRWTTWDAKLAYIAGHAAPKPVWVTETGIATWDLALHRRSKYELQVQMLQAAAHAPADRVYWYTLIDLDPNREAIEGFHVDENEYHLGLVTHDGTPKHAYESLRRLLDSPPSLVAPSDLKSPERATASPPPSSRRPSC